MGGRSAHGVGRRRRAPAGRRRICHQRVDATVLRPGHRPFRPIPPTRETASIFLPSVPNLLLLASEMEAQRNHVLGKPHRESQGDDEYVERRKSEPSELDNGFESLGADAELDQVIFDGSPFGTATPAGSEEEADYLGIPGLLDAGQMRDLLRRRQEEQLTKRMASGEVPVRRRTGSCGSFDASSTRWCRSPITGRANRTGGSTTATPGVRWPAYCGGNDGSAQGSHRSGALATGVSHIRHIGTAKLQHASPDVSYSSSRVAASSARCFSESSRAPGRTVGTGYARAHTRGPLTSRSSA